MASNNTSESFLPPRWVLTVTIILLICWLLSELKELVVLVVVGYCISYAIEPALQWLERRKISRSVGVFVIFAVVASVLLLLFVTALPTIARQYESLATNLPQHVAAVRAKLETIRTQLQGYLPPNVAQALDPGSIAAMLPAFDSATVGKVLNVVLGALLQGYSVTLTLVNLALLPFIVFYVSIGFPAFHRWVIALLPDRYQHSAHELGREIDGYTSAFARGQFIVCTILCVLYAFGLAIIGVDLWLLLAVISGYGNLIPYFGFLLGITLSSIMALVTHGTWWALFAVVGLYAVVQFIEGTFITPKVLGERVGLSPLAIILSLFAGGQLFGLLGVFLAVPAAAVLRVLLSHAHDWLVKQA